MSYVECQIRNTKVANHPSMVPCNDVPFKTFTFGELSAINFDNPPPDIAEYDPDEYWHYQKRLNFPIDLYEKITRPLGVLHRDEVDDKDVCMSFANDVYQMVRAELLFEGPGIPVDKKSIKTLPRIRCVYFLNERTSPDGSQWKCVYVGKAADLYSRWNESQPHHCFERACEAECCIRWYACDYGTESLFEAAMIYKLKPHWNVRQ